jgi:hypothetical protein
LHRYDVNWIKNIIEEREDGNFDVILYLRTNPDSIERQETVITVKNEFVHYNDKAAYAGSGDGELWVQVVEKAYAQALGHYEAIAEGGEAAETFEVLTGKQVTKGKLSNLTQEEFRTMIIDAFAKKRPITISSVILADGQQYIKVDDQAIYTNHVYYLNKVKAEFVHLNNPQGSNHLIISWDILFEYFSGYVIL